VAYIIRGLTADYEHFGDKKSLDAARNLADYFVARASAEPDRILGGPRRTSWMMTSGFDSGLLDLGKQTGDQRYLEFCRNVHKVPDWDVEIVTGRFGRITNHAYGYQSRCIDQIAFYRHDRDPKLLKRSRGMLGETCATVYLIEFLDAMIRLEGDSSYGDLMERAIYNALFTAQSPDGRRLRYYSPTDGPKIYWRGDTYCCPCNFRRGLAELPARVYYFSDGGPVVNIYTASTVKMKLDDDLSVTLKQETDYPNSGKVKLQITPSRPATFPIRLQIPGWATESTIAINGQPVKGTHRPGTFALITSDWKAGDTIELDMPMSWRFVRGRKAQSGRAAIMRGPVVFCLGLTDNPKLAKMRLEDIAIHPETIEGPFPDDTVRPDGMACRIKAVRPGKHISREPDLSLLLRECPDPAGRLTFFLVPHSNAKEIVDDELLSGSTADKKSATASQ